MLAHLDAHPGGEFTPHEIHKVLSHSSGAIANALDTLVNLGEAELATDKPRRFRRAAKRAAAAPGRRTTRAARRTARNWRVPREDPRRRPGRQHAAPAPAAGKPPQWFVLRPWLFDVTAAAGLLRARRARPSRCRSWRGTRLGADPRPGGQPAISLIGPGPGFDPEYARVLTWTSR